MADGNMRPLTEVDKKNLEEKGFLDFVQIPDIFASSRTKPSSTTRFKWNGKIVEGDALPPTQSEPYRN